MEFDDPNYVIKVCYSCTAAQTIKWRSGPMGPQTLCNACGIRYWKEKRAMELRGLDVQANANVGVGTNANVRVGVGANANKGKGRRGGTITKGRYKALKIRASDPY